MKTKNNNISIYQNNYNSAIFNKKLFIEIYDNQECNFNDVNDSNNTSIDSYDEEDMKSMELKVPSNLFNCDNNNENKDKIIIENEQNANEPISLKVIFGHFKDN